MAEIFRADLSHLTPAENPTRAIKAFVDRAASARVAAILVHPSAASFVEDRYPHLKAFIPQREGRADRVWRNVPVYESRELPESFVAAVTGEEALEILDSDEPDRLGRLEKLLGVTLRESGPDID